MYIRVDDEIIELRKDDIEGFRVEKFDHNNTSDDNESDFLYALVAVNRNGYTDSTLKTYKFKQHAIEVLDLLAAELEAISI